LGVDGPNTNRYKNRIAKSVNAIPNGFSLIFGGSIDIIDITKAAGVKLTLLQ